MKYLSKLLLIGAGLYMAGWWLDGSFMASFCQVNHCRAATNDQLGNTDPKMWLSDLLTNCTVASLQACTNLVIWYSSTLYVPRLHWCIVWAATYIEGHKHPCFRNTFCQFLYISRWNGQLWCTSDVMWLYYVNIFVTNTTGN